MTKEQAQKRLNQVLGLLRHCEWHPDDRRDLNREANELRKILAP